MPTVLIEPTAVKVTLNEDEMTVDLADGRRIIVPLPGIRA
jgi:hypothetical protein